MEVCASEYALDTDPEQRQELTTNGYIFHLSPILYNPNVKSP